MKVLWITNIVFPEAAAILAGNSTLKSTGGWMLGAAEALLNVNGVELAVASISNRVEQLTRIQGERITYYLIPSGKKYTLDNTRVNKRFEPFWKEIKKEYNPNVVHIHGTENSHGYAYIRACGGDNCVISIQGMTTVYYFFYYYGLTKCQILRDLSLSDVIRNNSIISSMKDFKKRSRYEKDMIRNVGHVIGRTDWDRAHVWAINPNAEYHFCNETLRPEFYGGEKWRYETCRKHSIFLSQGNYPIKGLHQVLKALPIIIEHYPDTMLYIGGKNIIQKPNSMKELFFYSGYGNIIRRMIKKMRLENHIVFLGNLDSEEMRNEYLASNLFVCPSSIENSPNSLGEAQLLGVPCLSSYVGGVMNMIPNSSCGEMYRYEEIEMMAWKVCKIFKTSENFNNADMISEALRRHDPKTNALSLFEIYKTIIYGN